MITPQLFYTVFFFILGLLFGSFFNLVGQRVPRGESIVYPGSHCETCERALKWYELIPVISYLFLLGKCRVCKTKLSPMYPIMELITGCLFAATLYNFGLTLETVYLLLIFSMLVIITVSDLTATLIPNKILLVFLILITPITFIANIISWKDSLIGLGVALLINILILLFSKGKGMGGGDVKLFMLLGLVMGWKAFIILFMLSVVIGLVVGLCYKFKSGEKAFPFGPSIALAVVLTIFYGNQIYSWYMGFYGIH